MCILYCVFEKKKFCSYFPSSFSIYFWQEPFAWRYWQSCQSLLQPFWHGSSSQQRATHQWPPRVNAGRSWSSKQQRVWHLAIQFSQSFVWTNHQSTFVFPFLLGWASLYTFDSSQLPQICCQLGALAIMATQITLLSLVFHVWNTSDLKNECTFQYNQKLGYYSQSKNVPKSGIFSLMW